MNKNLIIGLLILILGSLVVLVSSQMMKANRQRLEALEYKVQALEYLNMAKNEEFNAVHAAATARIAERTAKQEKAAAAIARTNAEEIRQKVIRCKN